MPLRSLAIKHLRNLRDVNIALGERFNIISGLNGSGKTSLLEAIHILSLGRSFRSRSADPLIHYDNDSFSVFSRLDTSEGSNLPLGIERRRNGQLSIRLDAEPVQSIAKLAELLPLQLINPDSYHLLEAGPKYRRQFLDWGVFHVEHQFFSDWQRFQKLLRQRNAALKSQNAPKEEVQLWDNDFAAVANQINVYRRAYVEAFIPVFSEVLAQLFTASTITLGYSAGWDEEKGLEAVLQGAFFRDKAMGHTQYGPHRADLLLQIDGRPAHEVLSRGQQKLVVCALRLAQGRLFNVGAAPCGHPPAQSLTALEGSTPGSEGLQSGERPAAPPIQDTVSSSRQSVCCYLVDDLPSELDNEACGRVISVLRSLNAQVFITSIEQKPLSQWIDTSESHIFRVQDGAFTAS